MSIRQWAYYKFAQRNKNVSDDDLIQSIQAHMRHCQDCSAGLDLSRETIVRWLDEGMTPEEYHRLYLSLDGREDDLKTLRPHLLLESVVLSEQPEQGYVPKY